MNGGVGAATEKPSWWVAVLLVPVRFYQRYISWMLGENCKYFPSCSSYAVQALTRHGVLKGSALAAWRLLRCNPWSRGGSDRVPARGRWRPDPYVPPTFDDDAPDPHVPPTFDDDAPDPHVPTSIAANGPHSRAAPGRAAAARP